MNLLKKILSWVLYLSPFLFLVVTVASLVVKQPSLQPLLAVTTIATFLLTLADILYGRLQRPDLILVLVGLALLLVVAPKWVNFADNQGLDFWEATIPFLSILILGLGILLYAFLRANFRHK
jgi:hypothetical protein